MWATLAAILRALIHRGLRRRRLKFIRMASAHAHARSQATNAMARPEVSAKKRNHAAIAQPINVRNFQPAPGLVSPIARARAIGARRIANDPKTRRLSLNRLSTWSLVQPRRPRSTWPLICKAFTN